ncbi:hypothetical protein GCM10007855_41230 [Aliivibrio sifiae]|uniref:Uncharacterized protein n=1 Tax=Aliivibrio sifiae TaxID=566293 RepID=A0ABQ6APL1_9GAMM|nr:hypothetical protein GCM10007855_41230 [Aliivibrio sifiae]
MQTKLNFTTLITETKGKLTMPSVANRVDAFVNCFHRGTADNVLDIHELNSSVFLIFGTNEKQLQV